MVKKKTTRWIPRLTYTVKKKKYEFLLTTKALTKPEGVDVMMSIFSKEQVKMTISFKRVRT